MARESILDALGDIARDKGISRDRLQEVVQEAITAAAKRKFKNFNEVEARINEKSGELEVFRYKVVTEEFTDPENEISLEEARKLDTLAEPGDEVEYEIDNQELSRVIAQTARQLIFQKIREAERETIYENYKDRKGEILNGIVSRTERNRIFITFNQVEAILYRREQIPNERYSPGEHIRVMLLDVINDPKEPSQLVISRADPVLLIKLFEMEVPEIYDGIVEIVTAAREAGRRAKIAVRSNDTDVDPVGACVGMRGSRVQSIISELRGEKIDIINWVDELPTYIANALAPAELTRIRINEEAEEIDVEVEPDQLSLAIGRQGQNVRLASKLIGYKINISSTQDKALSLEEQIRERLLASQAALESQQAGLPEGGVPFAGGAESETNAESGGEAGATAGEESTVGEAPAAEPGAETEIAAETGLETGTEPAGEKESTPGPETVAEPEPAVETKPEAEAEPETVVEGEAAAGEEPAKGDVPVAEPGTDPVAEPGAETEIAAETEPATGTEPVAEEESTPGPETVAESDTAAETEPREEAVATPEPAVETGPVAEVVSPPEPAVETVPEAEVVAASETTVGARSEEEAGAETEIAPGAEKKAESQPPSESGAAAGNLAGGETETEAEPEGEPETGPAAEPSSEEKLMK